MLGDIFISLDTTERQAQEAQVSHDAEIAWVLCHGVLHLLGYDHQNASQRKRMRAKEVETLHRLGVEKPVTV